MGILDNKSRIIDTVITAEGRRQLSTGMMKIEYFSFTDGDVFYQSSSLGVTDNASQRFYLESSPFLPSDQITLEVDDLGLVNSSLGAINHNAIISNGKLIEYSEYSGTIPNFLTCSAYVSTMTGVLSSSIQNFNSLVALRSVNRLFDDNTFLPSTASVTFDSSKLNGATVDLDSVPNIIEDHKTDNVINFKFLPPIKKLPIGTKYDPTLSSSYDLIDSYSQISSSTYIKIMSGSRSELTMDQIRNGKIADNSYSYMGLKNVEGLGQLKTISFDGNLLNRKVTFQVFEIDAGNSVTRKLDVLDLGILDHKTGERPIFVGKLLEKPDGSFAFMQIFVLVIK